MRLCMSILALVLIVGCSKSSSTSSTNSNQPTLQFTANGTVYQMNGNLATSNLVGAAIVRKYDTCFHDSTYWLEATDSAGDVFKFNTASASLSSTMNYTFLDHLLPTGPNNYCDMGGSGVILKNVSPSIYDMQVPEKDSTTTVIISIHNGLADGIFTGFLASPTGNPAPTISIIDGQFKNIPIVNSIGIALPGF